MRTAPFHLVLLRCFLGWILALQPMALGARAAEAIDSPFAPEICRGAGPGKAEIPAKDRSEHDTCCLAGCTLGGGIPPGEALALSIGAVAESTGFRAHSGAPFSRNAGFGPQLARAPPL